MEKEYMILTGAMAIFVVFFLIALFSALSWDKKYSQNRSNAKLALVFSFIIVLISIARLVLAIQMDILNASNIIIILLYSVITVKLFLNIRDRR